VVGRGARLLLGVLALTGCAIERPVPGPVSQPAPPLVSWVPLAPPPIISGFGAWRGEGGTSGSWQHAGVDIRVPVGTPVLAAADGVVVRAGHSPNAGRMILVVHADELATAYYHLAEIGVRAGQAVRRGEALGRTGMSGNATTPHLHFGVCRRAGGRCGDRIAAWEDPVHYWPGDGPCYDGRQGYAAAPLRLTYPVGCARAA
jgi:murein DD-endopeptidase MepM/ murein hydrolase activator NlpD